VAKAAETFSEYLRVFKTTSFCGQLIDLFERVDTSNLTKIVAFGLGGLTCLPDATLPGADDKNLLNQHAAVRAIRDTLLKNQVERLCRFICKTRHTL
jgi:hypothetical protein